MRVIVVLVMLVALAGCDHSEQDARRALTVAQGIQNEGRLFVALEAFEAIGKKYPQTSAATEAMKIAGPLRDQEKLASMACDLFAIHTGSPPKDLADFYRQPAGVKGWQGPYAAPGQLGHFGRWAVTTECGIYTDRWPDNDKFSGTF